MHIHKQQLNTLVLRTLCVNSFIKLMDLMMGAK